jgi:RNA polymerase sigma-70 factor, ECF subfamily
MLSQAGLLNMTGVETVTNPLLSDAPETWDAVVRAAGPASLLVLIETRMGPVLRAKLSAEDVLQDALLSAWRDRAKIEWRGHRAFRNWLVSVIENRIRDASDRESALKRGGGTASVSLRSGGSQIPSALAISTTPSRVAQYREQATAMRAALAQLPDEVRDVVRLRLFEQWDTTRIAAELGIGAAAVLHRFRRGAELYRARLTAMLSLRSWRELSGR